MPRNEFADHPGKGEEDEELNPEVLPVEEDPHMWPPATKVTLAELRRGPGATTTEAHIAELSERPSSD